MEARDRKTALRRSARAARRSLTAAEREAATAAIRDHLRHLPELRSAGTVLVYAASGSEVDVAAVAADLRASGAVTLYPRVRGQELDLSVVDDPATLVPGARGVPEPSGPASPVTVVDAVLVPGVAFDRRGGRLGQGGGHYDRLLPRIGDAVRIGVAFGCQVVPEVPRAEHDAGIDLLVTEVSIQRMTARTTR